MISVQIHDEWIRLDQLLKLAELVDSGGLAKILIQDGFVYVDGEICTMRGKKIRPGQHVHLSFPEGDLDEEIEVRGE